MGDTSAWDISLIRIYQTVSNLNPYQLTERQIFQEFATQRNVFHP